MSWRPETKKCLSGAFPPQDKAFFSVLRSTRPPFLFPCRRPMRRTQGHSSFSRQGRENPSFAFVLSAPTVRILIVLLFADAKSPPRNIFPDPERIPFFPFSYYVMFRLFPTATTFEAVRAASVCFFRKNNFLFFSPPLSLRRSPAALFFSALAIESLLKTEVVPRWRKRSFFFFPLRRSHGVTSFSAEEGIMGPPCRAYISSKVRNKTPLPFCHQNRIRTSPPTEFPRRPTQRGDLFPLPFFPKSRFAARPSLCSFFSPCRASSMQTALSFSGCPPTFQYRLDVPPSTRGNVRASSPIWRRRSETGRTKLSTFRRFPLGSHYTFLFSPLFPSVLLARRALSTSACANRNCLSTSTRRAAAFSLARAATASVFSPMPRSIIPFLPFVATKRFPPFLLLARPGARVFSSNILAHEIGANPYHLQGRRGFLLPVSSSSSDISAAVFLDELKELRAVALSFCQEEKSSHPLFFSPLSPRGYIVSLTRSPINVMIKASAHPGAQERFQESSFSPSPFRHRRDRHPRYPPPSSFRDTVSWARKRCARVLYSLFDPLDGKVLLFPPLCLRERRHHGPLFRRARKGAF